MPADFGVGGRVAIVTGGNVGIGREIAARFLEHGASVMSCSRREYDYPPALDLFPDGKERIRHITCDVRDADQVEALVASTVEEFGRVDILVNNAGGSPAADAATASPRFFAAVIATNLTSVMVVSQAANRRMQDQPDGGCIVNIASVAGQNSSPSLAAYGAAKAGVINVTRSLASEFGPKVRVNCVAPGFILTEGADYLLPTEEAKTAAAQTVPLKHLAGPDVIADVVLFLAAPASRYVNGETITVDGGGRVRGPG